MTQERNQEMNQERNQVMERTYKNILWIDPAVRDYQVFVDSVNADTLAVVYPEPIFDSINRVERIGFVFELHGPMAQYLLENASLLIGSGVKHMDFLACNTLPAWQPYYDTLTGIRVGASNNSTGNLNYGGDWLMESTCEDVEAIYFTKSIEYYKYLLGVLATTCIFKIGNILWGIGDNTYNQLGISDAGPLTTFVNITARQLSEFRNGTIVDFHYNQKSTIVTMGDGTVWMAGFANDQYVKSSTFEFVKVKLTTDSAGTKVLGKPILAKVSRVAEVSSTSYQKGNIWVITQYGTTYNLYIYTGDSDLTDGAVGSWNLMGNTYFKLANSKWKNATIKSELESGPMTNIYIEQGYGTYRIFCTSTNVYVSTGNTNQFTDRGITTVVSNTYDVDTPSYKLVTITTPTKAILNYSPNYVYFLQNGNVYADVNGSYTKCKSGGIDITGVTHLESNNQFISIVTNNASVWTINAPFTPTSATEFTVYPRNFGTITDIGMYMSGSINTLLVRSGNIIYNANTTTATTNTIVTSLITNTIVTSVTKTTAIINSSVNLLGYNFSTDNTSYLKIGNTSVDFSILSLGEIQFRVPNAPQTNASIDLYTNIGALRVPASFTIPPLFTLTRYNPSSVIPRRQLELIGSNFSDISYVRLGDKSVFPTSVIATQINVSVPIGLADQVTVTVFDLYNNSTFLDNLSILNMRVTTFDPTSAPQKSTLFLSGSNFSNLSSVRFGSINASFTRLSATNLSVRVPDGISLNSSVGVWDIYGNNASYPSNFTNTTFAVTTFAPTSGPQRTTVLLSGLNFSNISEVRFGTLNAPFEYVLQNLSVQVPVGILLNSSIRVWDIYGNNFSYPGNFTNTTFTVATFTPTTTIQKRTITLTGNNFSNISAVWFGTVPAEFVWTNTTNLSARVPDRTQFNCSIRVFDIYGNNASYAANFTYADSLVVTSIPNAPQKTNVVVVGTNFSNISAVLFSRPGGSANATFLFMSAVNLSVRIPDGIPVNTFVEVWDIFGNNSSTSFVNTTFTIDTFSASAPRKSNLLLTGTNLSNMSYVRFASVNASFTRINNFNLSTRVPDGIPINCSLGIGDIYGNNVSMNFTDTTFTLNTLPIRAPRKSILTIPGSNLSNLYSVRFATLNVSFSYDELNVSVKVPDGIPLNFSLGVWDIYGNNTSVNFTDTTFTLTQFSPTFEFKKGVLNLSGANLSNLSSVLFGSLNSSFTWNSSANVYAEVPNVVTNCSIDVADIYGNTIRYPETFTVTNLSYAFQVLDRLTLVGTGLTGLALEVPAEYTSSTAPMFRTTKQGTINLSRNELVTDTVPIYPVTVIQSSSKEVVTVRGMPTGKMPSGFGVYSV